MEAFTRRHSTIRRKSESGSDDPDPQTLQKPCHFPQLIRTSGLDSEERSPSSASSFKLHPVAVGRPNFPRRSDSLSHRPSTARNLPTSPVPINPLPSPIKSPSSTWSVYGYSTRGSESPGISSQCAKHILPVATSPIQNTAHVDILPLHLPLLASPFCTTDHVVAMPEVEFIPLPVYPKGATLIRSRSVTIEKNANIHTRPLARASAISPPSFSRSKSLSRSNSKTRELIV
ncbi:hypothetical protein BC830DRAFT_1159709 [Chytriomyces sp. MP71]|nr:hypothetical protein BC830DRAFT_1159709 [Chytriomyces sp. MP71]